MKAIILALIVVSLSGCATIFTGSKQTVTINSEPPDANIQVDGIDRGKTPAIIKLKKGNEGQVITLKLKGYETRTFQPETTLNPVAVLNLLSIVGGGVDCLSGALWKYDPKTYEIILEKNE